MRQLLVLSGKGGTGKTTVASSFIKLASARAYADCDVEAPNLHLILSHGEKPRQNTFAGRPKAQIDAGVCCGCGVCHDNCRFDALRKPGAVYEVDREACEGCGLCAALCPLDAVTLTPAAAGDLMLYRNDARAFSTAQLRIGAGTSGRLVAAVKEQMKIHAVDAPLAVVDGPPGIGCPVMASLAGADAVLLVAEPTLSGRRDLERILETVGLAGCLVFACVNRFDLDSEGTAWIERYCLQHGVICVGRIPYDSGVIDAVNRGSSVVDAGGPASDAIENVFAKVMEQMEMALPAEGAPMTRRSAEE